jgi:hypothetical protein
MKKMASQQELIEACDGIIVLSPDHPQEHERLGEASLSSGKRVYMDKTFSPDLASGQRLFDLAEKHGTPMFSSSALRFSKELAEFQAGRAEIPLFCATAGPGVYANYSVHQLEMINTVMGQGAKRIKAISSGAGRTLWVDYGDRLATMTQTPNADFSLNLAYEQKGMTIPACSDPFVGLIDAMLTFFCDGTVAVSREATLEVMVLREAGMKALDDPDNWIKVDAGR